MPPFDRAAYQGALAVLDAAACEAMAASQIQAVRNPATLLDSHIAYAASVHARLADAGAALMRAAPLSRWVSADFED